MPSLHLQPVADTVTQQNFDEISRQWPVQLRGTGDPNTVVTAGPGGQYVDLATGKLWVHEDIVVSDTGWVVK